MILIYKDAAIPAVLNGQLQPERAVSTSSRLMKPALAAAIAATRGYRKAEARVSE
jgi:hypothetical protein